MSDQKISIIVPCYKQAEFLDECLQSVMDQTYKNWECIIINDGSPDHPEAIAEQWIKKDARYKYFEKENGGVASARNFGIEKATGNWILPLDADDKIHQDYLSSAIDRINEGYDLIYCKGEYFGDKQAELYNCNYSFERLLESNIIFVSALFSKEISQGFQFDERLKDGLEDWEFWISLLSSKESKVFQIDQVLFYYRIKKESRNQNINLQLETLHAAKMYIYKKHEKIYLKYFGSYFNLLSDLRNLKNENDNFLKLKNSKKYKLIEKLLNMYYKLTS